MQKKIVLISCVLFMHFNCNTKTQQPIQKIISKYKKVGEIPLPIGFTRFKNADSSFSAYLKSLKILENDSVFLYNGQPKINQTAQFAVLNISVGKKDLQQCADAVMRLRAEYLFEQKKYEAIQFIDNELVVYAFTQPFTHQHLLLYLDKVFAMCGSASLSIQLKEKTDLQSIEPGDVFIKGGFPGHACIVLDVAKNEKNEKIFMLAQSYMPAQQIHILKNFANDDENPWYAVNEINQFLKTPEYTFTNKQLKQW